MDTQQSKVIEAAEKDVERAIKSKQPRFTTPVDFFGSVMRWLEDIGDPPKYRSDSRRRDSWLSTIYHEESHLAGVLDSATLIHANRGWSVTGGRNQVIRVKNALHNWMAFPTVSGWRSGVQVAATSYYATDINCILEIYREGARGGPFVGFRHVDPSRCRLSKNPDEPLFYYPRGERRQGWPPEDFVRLPSMPCTAEEFLGLGYCAVSRCLELAQLMRAVYQHDMEKLGARAPKGLLILHNIRETQWDQAMKVRSERLDGLEREYFGGVAVLATSGVDEVDARLVALSQLPDGFDIKVFTDLLMYGYALAFGFDPSEFWPVQFGSLGRGQEAQVQHQKATGKGGLAFPLALQEKLNEGNILPPTVYFEFDQRDDAGDLARASVAQAWLNVAKGLQEVGLAPNYTLELLAKNGIIPLEWTEFPDEIMTDTKRGLPEELQRNWDDIPDDEIVRYRYDPLRGGRITSLGGK